MTTQREHSEKTRPLAPDETNMSVTCKKEFASGLIKYADRHGASRNQFARAALAWVVENGGEYDHKLKKIVFPTGREVAPEFPAGMTGTERAVAAKRVKK